MTTKITLTKTKINYLKSLKLETLHITKSYMWGFNGDALFYHPIDVEDEFSISVAKLIPTADNLIKLNKSSITIKAGIITHRVKIQPTKYLNFDLELVGTTEYQLLDTSKSRLISNTTDDLVYFEVKDKTLYNYAVGKRTLALAKQAIDLKNTTSVITKEQYKYIRIWRDDVKVYFKDNKVILWFGEFYLILLTLNKKVVALERVTSAVDYENNEVLTLDRDQIRMLSNYAKITESFTAGVGEIYCQFARTKTETPLKSEVIFFNDVFLNSLEVKAYDFILKVGSCIFHRDNYYVYTKVD